MEGDQGQLSDQQITDKNIASVLQEAISRVAFEHQGSKLNQSESAALENVTQAQEIRLIPQGQGQISGLEQLIIVPTSNHGNHAQIIQHNQTGFAGSSQERIPKEQLNTPAIVNVSVSQPGSSFQPEVMVNQPVNVFQSDVSLNQPEVMSSSFNHVTKPDVYGRRQTPPEAPPAQIAQKEIKSKQAAQREKKDSETIELLSNKNEKLMSLNLELQEKLLQHIKDRENSEADIVRIRKEVQEQSRQILKMTKRNEKLTAALDKLRKDHVHLKKSKKKQSTRETKRTKRSVKIKKEEDEEFKVEEDKQSSEEEEEDDLNVDLDNDWDDPYSDPDQDNVDDSQELGVLDRGLDQDQKKDEEEAEDEKDVIGDLPKLDTGSTKKPFSCDLCHASYRSKGFLKAHQKRAHQGAPERRGRRKSEQSIGEVQDSADPPQAGKKHKCQYCSAQFKKACHLYRHERQIHKVHSLNRRNKIQYIPGTDRYVIAEVENKHVVDQIKQEGGAAGGNEDNDEVPPGGSVGLLGDNTESREAQDEGLPNELASDMKLPKLKVKKGFRCILCSKVFTQSCHLRRHERVVHRGERFSQCEICQKMFPDRSGLKEHMKVHSDAKDFSCTICGKSYKYSQKLRLHMQAHTGIKPFMCSVCGNTYSTKSYLKEHEVLHTGVKPYSCKYCSKSFAQSSALKIHEKTHTGEKNHICQYCSRAFITVQKLREHEYTHTGERPCKCKYCPKSFRTSIALRAHERLHTGERPYRCTICGKAFTQHPHLKSHILIHTGERPHSCKHCGKGFMTKGHLASHESVHTGLKPHKCDKCDKSFAKQNHLVRHMRIHTGEKPFICSHCGRGFSRSELLRTHEKQQHGIEHEKRAYPKLITPTKDNIGAQDSNMLVQGHEVLHPIGEVTMDLGQEVIYQNLPATHGAHQHPGLVQHQQHLPPPAQDTKVPAGTIPQQGTSHHIIIPGLGEQLYQESLAKSKQDPSGMSTSSMTVEQYWTAAQVSQYIQYPGNN